MVNYEETQATRINNLGSYSLAIVVSKLSSKGYKAMNTNKGRIGGDNSE